jgi:hypothetical protein
MAKRKSAKSKSSANAGRRSKARSVKRATRHVRKARGGGEGASLSDIEFIDNSTHNGQGVSKGFMCAFDSSNNLLSTQILYGAGSGKTQILEAVSNVALMVCFVFNPNIGVTPNCVANWALIPAGSSQVRITVSNSSDSSWWIGIAPGS